MAIVTRKGTRLHRCDGVIYVACMIGAAITVLVLATMRPYTFLFAVAIFLASIALSGWLPARGDNLQLGKVIGMTSFVAAVLLLGVGVWWVISGELFGIAAVVFGVISVQYGWRDVRRTQVRSRQQRISAHVSAMGVAFIATVSAVSAVTLELLPPLVSWLWPTIVGH